MTIAIAPNRAVAVLTPLVFAPAAGALSVLIAKYVPGVTIDDGSLTAIFVAGATIAFGKAGLWLKGWQDYEKREQLASHDAGAHTATAADPIDDLVEPLELDDEPELELDLNDEVELELGDELDFDDSVLDEEDTDEFDEERNGMSLSSTQAG